MDHIYVENAQEAYDSTIQAFKIAEDIGVSLPVIVGLDGFTISHTLENVNILGDDAVNRFVGERNFLMCLRMREKLCLSSLTPITR